MNASTWMTSLLGSQPDLYRAICDWNAYPHRWALREWWEEFAPPAALMDLLERSRRGRRRLGHHFRRALGLEDMYWDFCDPRRRLALLESPALERLARFAGAAAHAGALAKIVTRDERKTVTDHIGADAYAFALRRGRMVNPPSTVVQPDAAAPSLASLIILQGWLWLEACLRDEPAAVRQRFRLKQHRTLELPSSPGESPSTESQPDHAWTLLQPVLREALSETELRCFA